MAEYRVTIGSIVPLQEELPPVNNPLQIRGDLVFMMPASFTKDQIRKSLESVLWRYPQRHELLEAVDQYFASKLSEELNDYANGARVRFVFKRVRKHPYKKLVALSGWLVWGIGCLIMTTVLILLKSCG